MRPSEWRQLSEKEFTDEIARDLVVSLKSLLSKVQSDHGNGTEEAYVTALELANVGLWENLSPKTVAKAIWHMHQETVEALLNGVPKGPRLSISKEIAELEAAERSRQRLQARSAKAKLPGKIAQKRGHRMRKLTG